MIDFLSRYEKEIMSVLHVIIIVSNIITIVYLWKIIKLNRDYFTGTRNRRREVLDGTE